MKQLIVIAALIAGTASAQTGSISSMTDRGPLTLSTFDYTAGAFCSMTWGGVQFIDAKDHGRCLQSAVSFDGMGEAFNPTEAGGSQFTDGFLPAPSSSKVMNYVIDRATLATEIRMAFWDPVAGQRTSSYVHRKWVQVGMPGKPRVIAYGADFEIPATASHSVGQFEILTGYMPSNFSRFYTLNPATGALQTLDDGPGEQAHPVIFSTADGQHAIGIYSVTPLVGGGYGRWRFADCVKWNVVSRASGPRGTVRFNVRVVVGTLNQVVPDLFQISNAK